MTNQNIIKFRSPIINVILVIIVVLLGYHHLPFGTSGGSNYSPEECKAQYQYINTKVACGPLPVINKADYEASRREIINYTDTQISAGNLNEFAVYFRDLESGPVMGIHEDRNFAPASLLKLPVALTYMAIESREPGFLDKPISYQVSQVASAQHFPPAQSIQPNTPYPLKDLVRRTLVYSDNTSSALLEDYLTQIGKGDAVKNTFLDLGLLLPEDPFDQSLSVRRYSFMVRSLYNVSYLEKDLNEQILEWLAESQFTAGLKAGLPSDIQVAHKFGERVDESTKLEQLHDCGIVYFPDNPYLLCVMTRGNDFDKLAKVIANISSIIYKEVDSRKK